MSEIYGNALEMLKISDEIAKTLVVNSLITDADQRKAETIITNVIMKQKGEEIETAKATDQGTKRGGK